MPGATVGYVGADDAKASAGDHVDHGAADYGPGCCKCVGELAIVCFTCVITATKGAFNESCHIPLSLLFVCSVV